MSKSSWHLSKWQTHGQRKIKHADGVMNYWFKESIFRNINQYINYPQGIIVSHLAKVSTSFLATAKNWILRITVRKEENN